jgi:hypothetical protein
MKCEQYLKFIYIYSELNSKDRKMIDQHLPTCVQCQITFCTVVEQNKLVRSAFAGSSLFPDSRLTDKIMRSIEAEKPRKTEVAIGLTEFLQMSFVRYSLLVLSLVSISFFVAETFTPRRMTTNDMAASFKATGKKNVTLNSDLFYRSSRDTLSRSPREGSGGLSIYECMRFCESQTDNTCLDCRKKFSKLAKI